MLVKEISFVAGSRRMQAGLVMDAAATMPLLPSRELVGVIPLLRDQCCIQPLVSCSGSDYRRCKLLHCRKMMESYLTAILSTHALAAVTVDYSRGVLYSYPAACKHLCLMIRKKKFRKIRVSVHLILESLASLPPTTKTVLAPASERVLCWGQLKSHKPGILVPVAHIALPTRPLLLSFLVGVIPSRGTCPIRQCQSYQLGSKLKDRRSV
ncbi:hypothetical protein F4680DRAFT_51925 [Xylaria scruposa]|nr:hypothetical protein F4680DRAFT_51925 [Xylaria scruposa]